jgi:mannitol-1-phosphate/altronate dehydrogenase
MPSRPIFSPGSSSGSGALRSSPILAAPPDLNLGQYADQLFERYSNPAIRHSLWQIAMDGSQKLPQRLLFHCPGQSQPETPFQARRARRSRLDALCLRRRRSRRNHRRPGSPSGSSSRPNRFRRSRPGGASASACDRRSGVRQRPTGQRAFMTAVTEAYKALRYEGARKAIADLA